MSPRYDDEWVAAMLDVKGRLGTMAPKRFLVDSGLRWDDTVVDLGCGPGFLTLPAAEIVGPGGRVYAVDIEQKMVDMVGRRAAEMGLENVTTVFSSGDRTPLPDGIADYAICALVLHYRLDPSGRAELARDIGRLVRPAGRALVIKWSPESMHDTAQRVSYEELEADMREAGFESEGPHPLGETQYILIASRLDGPR